MSGARQARAWATLLAAALVAGVSLSGAIRARPEPIAIEIPSPFGAQPAAQARPLAPGAPDWARRLYSRSLIVLRNLTNPATGAQIAGTREQWRYVWPRDAAAGALALAAAGETEEAERIVTFLRGLDLDAAGRFETNGDPAPGRPAAGDATGWVNAAARAVGAAPVPAGEWTGRQDYGENVEGDLLGNAIAGSAPTPEIASSFRTPRGLARREHGGALDSAAAWAVAPFPRPALREQVRESLLALASGSSRFGIAPTEDWTSGEAWTAPTAWTAWALERLGERRAADRLLAALHRAESTAGTLPERVSTADGRPLSVTPLAWSHAFAALALLERYPRR